MKILVLGGDGMLGHQLLHSLSSQHEVRVTLRATEADLPAQTHFTKNNTFFGIDVLNDASLVRCIMHYRPDVIINASGVIKQRLASDDKALSLQLNALLPHRLAMLTRDMDIKVIQFSTDCIFSGMKGNYLEDDASDAEDTYGKTKHFGEIIDEAHCLTLRTSFFGLELKHHTGLIEWFLQQQGEISGYSKAIYSGLSTIEMARVLDKILQSHPDLNGLYHLSSDPINKYELLSMLSEQLGRDDISIQPNDTVCIDRSLNSDKLRTTIDYTPPSWPLMLEELGVAIQQRETL